MFEEVSLRGELDLWLSEDEGRFEERVRLLSRFPECGFEGAIAAHRERAAKREDLAEAFADRAEAMMEKEDGKEEEEKTKVLRCLDRALLLAESGGKAAAKTLRLRAAALLRRGRAEEGLRDAEEALKGRNQGGDEEEEEELLLLLKCRAHLEMGHKSEAEGCLREVAGRRGRSATEEMLRGLETKIDAIPKEGKPKRGNEGDAHFKLSFSDKVEVREDKGGSSSARGRYLVALEALSPGELFATDCPGRLRMLDPGRESGHCWHCLSSTPPGSVLSCPGCASVGFCSDACRREAGDTYHK